MLKTLYYEDNTKKIDVLDKLILLLYGGYFILTPFYLWSSGIPQLADFILVFTLILFFLKYKLKFRLDEPSKKIAILLVILLFWVTTVNLLWTVGLVSNIFRPIIYYLFNIIIAIFTMTLQRYYKKSFLLIINKSIIISLIIQFFYLVTSDSFGIGRAVLSFNNPNQLGYFGLLSAALLIVTNNKLKSNTNNINIGLFMSFSLVLASLSNAAIISWIFIVFFYVLSNQTSIKSKRKIIVSSSLIIIILVYIYNNYTIIQENLFYQSLMNRLSQTTDKVDSSLYVRGYNRILDYPEYLFFGAGEGANYRFSSIGLELHSTIGSILFSYGLVGTFLFNLFVFKVMYHDKFKHWYLIVGILIYGFSHNGVRNSLFWIILVLLIPRKQSMN